jgi:MscS family membrane protein
VVNVRRCAALLVLLALAHAATSQVIRTEPSQSEAAPQPVTDLLGRTTPRSSIAGFVRAVDRGDFVSAARYMQLTSAQRPNAEALAVSLKGLMDRYLTEALVNISDSPAGAIDDRLAMDREQVGPLVMGRKRAYITLVRVTDPQSGPIWLISSDTLAQVPGLRGAINRSWIERVMPDALVDRSLFGISLAHWTVLAASLFIPFVLLTLASAALIALARAVFRDPPRRDDIETWYAGIRWPLILVLTLSVQLMSMPSLGFPVTFRSAYARVGLVLLVLTFVWLLRRLLTLGFARARNIAWGRDRTSTQSLLLLGERLLKALVILVAIFAILTIVGVNTKTALAGVGIGGIALALGAQRTVENLLGGIFLLTDKAIAVGDLVNISSRLGWIEDITLRSVRLRTLDHSLLSIPAGVLAQEGIENFASRNKILAQSTLRLRYGTSVAQLQRIMENVRALLAQSPRIEKGTARIRLVNFGAEAIELELFAYVLTANVPEFLAAREELLMRIAEIVEAAGSAFAPIRFIYMEDSAGTEAPARISQVRDSGPRSEVRVAQAGAESKALASR